MARAEGGSGIDDDGDAPTRVRFIVASMDEKTACLDGRQTLLSQGDPVLVRQFLDLAASDRLTGMLGGGDGVVDRIDPHPVLRLAHADGECVTAVQKSETFRQVERLVGVRID